jgi:enoyl-CoA hydratase/3-hydroxyacyl-CoA dehydrogenase
MAAAIGYEHLHAVLSTLASETGATRYEPDSLLTTWAEEGGPGKLSDAEVSYETIRIGRPREGLAHIVLDRPQSMNTVSETMLDDLDTAIDTLDADDTVTAVLLTGEGDRAFCAGADIQGMASGVAPFDAVEFSRKGQETFGKLRDVSMPVVAGVDGFCLGGGMELATCVDLCVASKRSEFGQPEHDLGIIPGWGGTQRLSRIVGERRAREIIFTADRFDAETMYDYGFVNEVVDNVDLLDRAEELATNLAQGPPLAQGTTKRAMIAGQTDIDAGLAAESDGFGLLWTTADSLEGIDAFVNQRDPEFEGK